MIINANHFTLLCICCVCLCIPLTSHAELKKQVSNYIPAYIDIGLSNKITKFRVESSQSKLLGEMESKLIKSYFVNIAWPDYYFQNSASGIQLTLSATSIDIDSQDIGAYDVVSLGTEIKGEYFNLMPTWFYHWGDRQFYNNQGIAARIGLGTGIAYLHLQGDVLLTDADPEQRITVDLTNDPLALSAYAFAELRINFWTIRANLGRVFKSASDLDYQLRDENINLGFVLRF
jgi:hypothetical protein